MRLRLVRPHLMRSGTLLLAATLLAFSSVLAGIGPGHSSHALATQQPPLTGLLFTLAATADDVELQPEGGLVLQVTLTNATGQDLGAVSLRAPVPPRARVTGSWYGPTESGLNPGEIQGGNVVWSGITLEEGERLGPFAYRVVPEPGENGAVIFREARVQPQVTWSLPEPGAALAPPLRLNGLWGDGALRRTLLPTGLTVFTRERPDSLTVSLRLAIRAGSRDEDDTTSGGSHWLEHAHFLGTVDRPDDEIDTDIAIVGGEDNASTGWEHTDYWKLVPAQHFDIALDVLADQILNSTFLPEAFERERSVVFEELKLRNDTPSTRAFDEFINLVFRESPLRRHPSGTIESVQSIPIATILAHRDRHYVTGNMAIAAIGNLRHDEAVRQIEEAFADLPRGPRTERPAVPEPPRQSIERLEVGSGERLAEIRLGWPVPGDDSRDAPVLYIIDDLLDATGRRLAEEIRDRRALASSVGAGYLDFSDAGAFLVTASTRPDRVDEVVALVLAQIQRLHDGDVTEDEIRASLRANAGRRALNDESNQDQTGRAIAEVAGVLDSFDEYNARLATVTPADVQRVARTYLGLDNYVLVIVRS